MEPTLPPDWTFYEKDPDAEPVGDDASANLNLRFQRDERTPGGVISAILRLGEKVILEGSAAVALAELVLPRLEILEGQVGLEGIHILPKERPADEQSSQVA